MNEIKIPSRSEAIKEFKQNGGKIAAVFPIHYPRALFRAYNILPVEVWGPPGATATLWEAHLQSYTCCVIRHGLTFLLQGGLDSTDLIVVPHCCDTLQGLGSILLDYIPPKQPVFPFYIPRDIRDIDIEYFARELSRLGDKLKPISGTNPGDKDIMTAIDNEDKANSMVKELFRKRTKLNCSNKEFYRIIRSREYLPVENFLEIAEKVLEQAVLENSAKTPVLLSGILPEPMDVLDVLTEHNSVIVADDLLSTGRRLYAKSSSPDPYVRMAESIIKGPPDSTLGNSFKDRFDYLYSMVNDSGARGVIFFHVKFCEPEQFYYPALRKGLDDKNIPSLLLEAEIGDPLPGQVVTRLESFMEVLS